MSVIEGRHIRYQIPIPDLFYLQIAIRDPRVASARNRSSHPMLSLATRTEPHGLSDTGIELNDVHSRLNATRVGAVIRPADVAGAVEAVRAAAHVGEPPAVMGARHAMGGQKFLSGGRVLARTDERRVGKEGGRTCWIR